MKASILLGNLMPVLPTELRDAVHAAAKADGRETDALEVRRVGHEQKADVELLESGSRAAVRYVSARTLDRDNEIVVPGGVDTKDFQKYGHVLWGHNYSLPPLGSDEWIKADDWGLKAKTVYADTGEGTMANVVWHLVQQGHLKASSIGFVPLAWTEPGHNDFEKVAAKLESAWPEFGKVREKVKRVITKAVLLEHSDVSVPACPDALTVGVAKQHGAGDAVLKSLGWTVDAVTGLARPAAAAAGAEADDKGAIPYSVHGDVPKSLETAEWNGPREVAAASVEELRLMCAWMDSKAADMKGSYKLPHHRHGGQHVAVWAGVRAAMGALLGARGGVAIPAGDRKAVYAHLTKHYAQWDKEPPELREYTQGECKALFPELYEVSAVRVIERAVRPIERSVRVMRRPDWLERTVEHAVHDALDKRSGRIG